MPISWSYTPPSVDGILALHAAGEAAVAHAADAVLGESQRLVPVDTGALQASGKVTRDGLEATISYGDEDGAGRDGQDTAQYAIPVHERLDAEHPAGQAKFLEAAMHTTAAQVGEVLADTIRRAIDG